MPRTFPIPREHVPKLNVGESEHTACRRFMDIMLANTVREFEDFAYSGKNGVDLQRWKPQSSHDELAVYRERQAGATSKQLTRELTNCLKEPVLAKTRAALAPPTLLLSGVGHGLVENAMEAVVTQSQQELALVVTFMHDEVADCAIVHTLEPPSTDRPFHFLGYKYFVKKSPTDPHIVKHRSSLYLESTGMTRSSTGERLGYHLMHTVHLPKFPDLSGHQAIEALQSIRYIYRQRNDKLVEVFALANMDLSGMIVRPLSNFLVVGAITGVVRLLDLAEARRLTNLAHQYERNHPRSARRQRSSRLSSSSSTKSVPTLASSTICSVCHGSNARKGVIGPSGGAGGRSRLISCYVCGQGVCSRCHAAKRVFYGDAEGVMGQFKKVVACMTCVRIANSCRRDFQSTVQDRARRGSATRSNRSVDTPTCRDEMPSYKSDLVTPSAFKTTEFSRQADATPATEKTETKMKPAASGKKGRSERGHRTSLPEATERRAATIINESDARVLEAGKTAAKNHVHSSSAPSPMGALVIRSPQEFVEPPVASAGVYPTPRSNHDGLDEQQQMWLRLQQISDMAENTYSLAQRNAAVMMAGLRRG